MNELLAFVAGAVFGIAVFLLIHLLRRRETVSLARELVSQAGAEKIKTSKPLSAGSGTLSAPFRLRP